MSNRPRKMDSYSVSFSFCFLWLSPWRFSQSNWTGFGAFVPVGGSKCRVRCPCNTLVAKDCSKDFWNTKVVCVRMFVSASTKLEEQKQKGPAERDAAQHQPQRSGFSCSKQGTLAFSMPYWGAAPTVEVPVTVTSRNMLNLSCPWPIIPGGNSGQQRRHAQ